ERADGWAVDDFAGRVITRAVARTVPRFFRRVPADDATKVRADGGVAVNPALFITVDRQLLQTASDDGAVTGGDPVFRFNVAASQPVRVLRGHVEIFQHIILRRRLPRRVVQFGPPVLVARDQVGDQ